MAAVEPPSRHLSQGPSGSAKARGPDSPWSALQKRIVWRPARCSRRHALCAATRCGFAVAPSLLPRPPRHPFRAVPRCQPVVSTNQRRSEGRPCRAPSPAKVTRLRLPVWQVQNPGTPRDLHALHGRLPPLNQLAQRVQRVGVSVRLVPLSPRSPAILVPVGRGERGGGTPAPSPTRALPTTSHAGRPARPPRAGASRAGTAARAAAQSTVKIFVSSNGALSDENSGPGGWGRRCAVPKGGLSPRPSLSPRGECSCNDTLAKVTSTASR